MSNPISKLVVFCLICSGILGCSLQKSSHKVETGVVKNYYYVNDFFGLRIPIPRGWQILNERQRDRLYGTKSQTYTSEPNLKKLVKVFAPLAKHLFTAYEFEVGRYNFFNSSISISAEDFNIRKGVKDGSDFLYTMRAGLLRNDHPFDHVDTVFQEIWIDSVQFYSMYASEGRYNEYSEMMIVATVIKHHALVFTFYYQTEEIKDFLLDLLKRSEFDKEKMYN